MNIDRNKCTEIAADIRKALADVAAKHGLDAPSVDLRRSTSGSFVRLMKLDMSVKMPASNSSSKPMAPTGYPEGTDPALVRACARLGIKSLTNSKGDRLIAYKSSRPKYPFTYEGPRGGRWKTSEMEARIRWA